MGSPNINFNVLNWVGLGNGWPLVLATGVIKVYSGRPRCSTRVTIVCCVCPLHLKHRRISLDMTEVESVGQISACSDGVCRCEVKLMQAWGVVWVIERAIDSFRICWDTDYLSAKCIRIRYLFCGPSIHWRQIILSWQCKERLLTPPNYSAT